MLNGYKGCSAAVFVLAFAACSGEGDLVVDRLPIDYSGQWISKCALADTSLVPELGDVYYHDSVDIAANRIALSAEIFTDSDCVTVANYNFSRNTLFEEGEYTQIAALTTESGLVAHSIEIQVADNDEVIPNIIAISNDMLYFGYSLFDGPLNDEQLSLRALDLDNTYRRR